MSAELFYLSAGTRNYFDSPIRCYHRQCWEFQAVIEGAISPVIEGQCADFHVKSLWVFSPEVAHGWTGQAGAEAEVIVFHLPAPDMIVRRELSERGGWGVIELSPSDIDWLSSKYNELTSEWRMPNEMTHLKVQRLLLGLQFLILGRLGFRPRSLARGRNHERIQKALYWYRHNLHDNPGVDDVAAVLGISGAHFRRLCLQELHKNPKQALQDIRFESIADYLSLSDSTVECAAEAFGFADASSLTRAYRNHFGTPPRRHRQKPNPADSVSK